MKFNTAIVRIPCRNMVNGLTSANLGFPNYQTALKQHKNYIKALKACGLTVYNMPPDENYPDSCFIEDTAIVDEKIAIIVNPSEPTRKGEEILVREKLLKFYDPEKIVTIQSPGTLDGGDVMRVEDTYYIGISKRTNQEGALQLKIYLESHGYTTHFVPFSHCLHLKSEVNYIGSDTLLISSKFLNNSLFKGYICISVDDNEVYAANSLCINKKIITPKGFPKTKQLLIDYGFSLIELEMSEFQKLDGGLSCLSLRFNM